MADRYRFCFKQLLRSWKGLHRKNKLPRMAITATVLVALGVSVYLMNRPAMVEIFKGLDMPTLSAIQGALSSASPKINSKIDVEAKSIRVRVQDVDHAIVVVESQHLISD